MTGVQIVYLVILGLCILGSGFFSGSETALVSVPRERVAQLLDTDKRAARLASVTKNTCFATEPMTAETGASWKASLPIACVGTWPQITTMGTESAMQSRTGVTVLVAPGPEVTMATPTLPVERE